MGPDPGPVVVIGLQQIYETLIELRAQVAMLVHQDSDRAADITDHETRLRTLEETQPSRRLSRLEDTVDALKAGRWPLPSLAVLLSAGALLWTVFGANP